jgi:hypothetical protein
MSEQEVRADGPASERRSEPRRPCCWEQTVIRVTVRPSFQPFPAQVRNVSARGIGFLHQDPLEPGAVLALQLRAGVAGTSCIRTGRVVHATPCGGEWLIGCTISPPFSPRELEALW